MNHDVFLNVLRDKIASLEQELVAFVENANRQIAAQQGAIAALQQLLTDVSTGVETSVVPDEAAGESGER